jgi:hypothetical protein
MKLINGGKQSKSSISKESKKEERVGQFQFRAKDMGYLNVTEPLLQR